MIGCDVILSVQKWLCSGRVLNPDLFKDNKLSVDTLSKAQNQTITDFLFNPLSPRSDKHEISPYDINALEERVVTRIEYMSQGR